MKGKREREETRSLINSLKYSSDDAGPSKGRLTRAHVFQPKEKTRHSRGDSVIIHT